MGWLQKMQDRIDRTDETILRIAESFIEEAKDGRLIYRGRKTLPYGKQNSPNEVKA